MNTLTKKSHFRRHGMRKSNELLAYPVQEKITNSTYNDIISVMENPIFSSFFIKYLLQSSTRDAMIIFLKMYHLLDHYKFKLTPEQKISVIDSMINNSELRPKILKRLKD